MQWHLQGFHGTCRAFGSARVTRMLGGDASSTLAAGDGPDGHVRIVDSCVHDNSDGGIQATNGGTVTAERNVVQLNRPGSSQNGLLVGVPDQTAPLNTMVTDGNVVRFSGARGISVVNAAAGTFTHDVVTDNEEAGAVVETAQGKTPVSPDTIPSPTAVFRGVGFDCNYKQISGTCHTDDPTDVEAPCGSNDDCPNGLSCTYEEPDGSSGCRSIASHPPRWS
jgi:hypothetical protein